MTQAWWKNDCLAINEKVKTQAQDRQGMLTKPPGSLGLLEEVAITLASLYGDDKPEIKQPLITIFAGDHGVVAQGVSAFPQAVTVEMMRNFVNGGAAISVLAKVNEAELKVVNCGTAFEVDFADDYEALLDKQVAPGTADLSLESAMSAEQLEQALSIGQQVIEQGKKDGIDLFIAGEMGIGNTTPAAALGCAYIGQSAAKMTGRGTGIDDAGLNNKISVIEKSLARLQLTDLNAEQILQELGGFEIAAITGAYIRCAQLGIPALVDGFITTAAALAACKMNPQVHDWLLFSHQSEEQGHKFMLEALEAKPLLSLGLRLGEGSGAATALPLLRQACALHNGMATFAEAAVSEAGASE
ncbi:MAG: nicotinate-nucleotide--dimethylbenzimidazole phosphoribosyltransferase [Oleispira sp.]